MKSIAVIGAGQLGSRHLQAVLKLNFPNRIWVVDPSLTSLETARARAAAVQVGIRQNIKFVEDLSQLPDELDYVIISTSSDVRFKILERLLSGHRVRYLLLEKVLFQDLAHYRLSSHLLQKHGVSAWVNCTRRVYPVYQQIREFFAGETLWKMDVLGGDWGLACNSIHFLDLFSFLSGEPIESVTTGGLDLKAMPSKRSGFVEFSGTLTARSHNGRFEATSVAGSSAPLVIQIRSETRTCIVDEGGGAALFFEHSDKLLRRESFTTPYLSDVGAEIANAILMEGRCGLPTYEESAACHLPLVRALASFAAPLVGGSDTFCPIT